MKVHQYREMMRWLTRPKIDPSIRQLAARDFYQGGRVGMKPGGLVEPGVTHYGKKIVGTNQYGVPKELTKKQKALIKKYEKVTGKDAPEHIIKKTKAGLYKEKMLYDPQLPWNVKKQAIELQTLVNNANAGDKFFEKKDIYKLYGRKPDNPTATKILNTLESRDDKVKKVFNKIFNSDEAIPLVKGADASNLKLYVMQQTGIKDPKGVANILKEIPDYKNNIKLFSYLSSANLSRTDLKDMNLKQQLNYADDMLKGRMKLTGMPIKGTKLLKDPNLVPMLFAKRNWEQNKGKGLIKLYEGNKEIKWETRPKSIDLGDLKFTYGKSSKKYDLKFLREYGKNTPLFKEVYKSQNAVNDLLRSVVDNPFKPGTKINFGTLMSQVYQEGYGWKPKAAILDIMHGPGGVKADPFKNLSVGTKRLNVALRDLDKIPLKGLKNKMINQAYGQLKGKEGAALIEGIKKQQLAVAEEVAGGKKFYKIEAGEKIKIPLRAEVAETLLEKGNLGTREKEVVANILNKFFRCGQADGLSCDDPKAYMKSINEEKALALAGDTKAISKFDDVSKAVRAARGISKFTAWGILVEVAFAPVIALPMLAEGESWSRIMNDISYGLFGESEQEELKRVVGTVGTQNLEALEAYEKLQKLESLPLAEKVAPVDSFMGGDLRRKEQLQARSAAVIAGRKKELEESAKTFVEKIQPFVVDGVFDEAAFSRAGGDVEAAKAQIEKDKLARKESSIFFQDKLDPTEEMVGFDAGGSVDYYDNYLPDPDNMDD